MALSNIFREPRREITESVVGLSVFGVYSGADIAFAWWLGPHKPEEWVFGLVAGAFASAALFLALLITHELGAVICDAFQRNGIHLRPRNRPR